MSTDFALTSPVAVGGRESHDHYPTPSWCTRMLLDWIGEPMLSLHPFIIDPFAGEGAILDVVLEMTECGTKGIEIDTGRAEAAQLRGHDVVVGDAFVGGWRRRTPVITNPPYSRAFEAAQLLVANIERGVTPWGAMLLRASFIGSQQRAAFHREYPAEVRYLPRRPSFDGVGNDSADSAWFIWGTECGGEWSVLP